MTMRAKRYQNSAALHYFLRRTFPAEPVEPVEHVEPVKPNASGLLGDSRKTIHADGTLTAT